MKYYYSVLFALLLVVSACSPSIERIQTILDAYISASGEDGSTVLMSVEQTDKGIYSGTYSVGKDSLTMFVYPFTAIVKKDQVMQFFKDTDDNKIAVITFLPEGQGQYHSDETGLDYNVETKVAYEERLRKEEEERQAALAASRRASGDGLGQVGANYLLAGHNNVIQVISYKKASQTGSLMYQAMFGADAIVYAYKVLVADGYGGTKTTAYDLVFKNGNVVFKEESSSGSDFLEFLDGAAQAMYGTTILNAIGK